MIINEDSRQELVAKSKRSQKGLQRYKKRLKSRILSSVKEFNQIDMNQLFKDNIITIKIKIHGETDDYLVKISYGGVLDEIKRLLQPDQNIDLSILIRALINAFNRNDVYISCNCPDFYYRYGFYATVNKINSGEPQLIPSKETNPDDTLGSGCKHILLVLANTSWIIKVASVIKNYIEYMKKNRQQLYANIIYPSIYGKKYEEPVQLSMDNTSTLETDSDIIDKSNIEARKKGQFEIGNQYRFKPKDTLKSQIDIEDEVPDEQ